MSMQLPLIRVRRVYEEAEADDGYRVLVDRLWPRGVAKAVLAMDEWAKDAAPSPELRRWYGHDPERFPEFAHRYRGELEAPPAAEALDRLAARARGGPVTLLTAARDVDRSSAAVIRAAILEKT